MMTRKLVLGIGKRIRELRAARGMKQAILARRSGIGVSHLSELETSDAACPSALVLHKIADALGTSTSYLLGMSDDGNQESDGPIPETLLRAKARFLLSDHEVAVLRRIEHRGRRPQTEEDWFFLVCAIRRSVR